jgi:hypothetical protein
MPESCDHLLGMEPITFHTNAGPEPCKPAGKIRKPQCGQAWTGGDAKCEILQNEANEAPAEVRQIEPNGASNENWPNEPNRPGGGIRQNEPIDVLAQFSQNEATNTPPGPDRRSRGAHPDENCRPIAGT